ncbi:MAG: helix-turn-helix domain-containing protein [Parvularculaceae bacterium]
MSQNREFFIGAVSERTGLKVETIRYYENAGVIPSPARGDNRYRVYKREDVARLLFVKRCRELGFSLDHVASLLELANAENRTCGQVSAIAEGRLKEVRAKIADLKRMETVLEDFVASCPRDSGSDCPIITALTNTARLCE